MNEIRKIANVIRISQEEYVDYANREPLMTSIRLAPARRARRLAEETYWQNDEGLDNPCIVRAEN